MNPLEESRNLLIKVEEAGGRLRKELAWENLPLIPHVGLVLGSGLGNFTSQLSSPVRIDFKKIPHLKESSVPGHAGQWVYGIVPKVNRAVLVSQGRIHSYEGFDLATITIPIRVFHFLGIRHLILTNAAGSVNPTYQPGQFMMIDDHINLMGMNPLRGFSDERLGPRFVDMSEPYDKTINEAILTRIQKTKPEIKLHRGVYAALQGPSYETPAEIRMLHRLGVDAVGMSTVPETIVARQCGMKINAISSITNLGSGLSAHTLSHQEVKDMGARMAPIFATLIEELLALIR